VAIKGSNFEESNFWEGISILDGTTHPLEGATVAYFGSVFASRPSTALTARALGVPIICTPGVGLEGHLVEFGDEEKLEELLLQHMNRS
jgi:hypothetical protein